MKEYLEIFLIWKDFDFTNDPQALDASLRKKKSWIMSVNAEEYMPYEFIESSQRGRRKVPKWKEKSCDHARSTTWDNSCIHARSGKSNKFSF